MASELESDLRDTVDWSRKWLVDSNIGKTQLVSFGWSNNTGAIDMKMDGSVLDEKSSFKMLGLTFSSKLDWGSCIISIAKKEVPLYLCKSVIWPCMEYCCHVWVVLLIATWNCWISCKHGYVGMLVLYFLTLFNLWHIVEMWPM